MLCCLIRLSRTRGCDMFLDVCRAHDGNPLPPHAALSADGRHDNRRYQLHSGKGTGGLCSIETHAVV